MVLDRIGPQSKSYLQFITRLSILGDSLLHWCKLILDVKSVDGKLLTVQRGIVHFRGLAVLVNCVQLPLISQNRQGTFGCH